MSVTCGTWSARDGSCDVLFIIWRFCFCEMLKIKTVVDLDRIMHQHKHQYNTRDMETKQEQLTKEQLALYAKQLDLFAKQLDLYAKQLEADRKQLTADKNKLDMQMADTKSGGNGKDAPNKYESRYKPGAYSFLYESLYEPLYYGGGECGDDDGYCVE